MIIENIMVIKGLYFVGGLGCGIAVGLYLGGIIETGDVLWGFRR